MPKPGKEPLKRLPRLKGPVYLQASLCDVSLLLYLLEREPHVRVSGRIQTYALAHGSFAGWPAAAANFCGSKPVRLGRGAIMLSV